MNNIINEAFEHAIKSGVEQGLEIGIKKLPENYNKNNYEYLFEGNEIKDEQI